MDNGGSRNADRRARLLEAAVAAFAARGFHATTTRDIAAAAGMSPAAVYVHHETKEQLLYEISREGHAGSLALVRKAIATTEDPAAQLAAVIRAFVTDHARSPTIARVVNYELAALTPEHRAEIEGIRRTITGELRQVVERGVADGAFETSDPRMTTAALLSLGIDVARWYRQGLDLSPEGIGDFYAALALRIVGHRGD